MNVKFITLGCKVNQVESEAMREALLAGGFQEAAEGQTADVVVVNSCTVTAVSDQKAARPCAGRKSGTLGGGGAHRVLAPGFPPGGGGLFRGGHRAGHPPVGPPCCPRF